MTSYKRLFSYPVSQFTSWLIIRYKIHDETVGQAVSPVYVNVGLDLLNPSVSSVIPAKAGIQSISTHVYELI